MKEKDAEDGGNDERNERVVRYGSKRRRAGEEESVDQRRWKGMWSKEKMKWNRRQKKKVEIVA